MRGDVLPLPAWHGAAASSQCPALHTGPLGTGAISSGTFLKLPVFSIREHELFFFSPPLHLFDKHSTPDTRKYYFGCPESTIVLLCTHTDPVWCLFSVTAEFPAGLEGTVLLAKHTPAEPVANRCSQHPLTISVPRSDSRAISRTIVHSHSPRVYAQRDPHPQLQARPSRCQRLPSHHRAAWGSRNTLESYRISMA